MNKRVVGITTTRCRDAHLICYLSLLLLFVYFWPYHPYLLLQLILLSCFLYLSVFIFLSSIAQRLSLRDVVRYIVLGTRLCTDIDKSLVESTQVFRNRRAFVFHSLLRNTNLVWPQILAIGNDSVD